jgi:hypothetical protein
LKNAWKKKKKEEKERVNGKKKKRKSWDLQKKIVEEERGVKKREQGQQEYTHAKPLTHVRYIARSGAWVKRGSIPHRMELSIAEERRMDEGE